MMDEVPEHLQEAEVEQCGERERLRARVEVLEESLRSSEVECRASRGTLLRLVEEVEVERRRADSITAVRQSLQVELEGLAVGRRSGEQEKQGLVERVEAAQRVVQAAQRESRCLQAQAEDVHRQLHRSRAESRASRGQLDDFLERLAQALLRGGGVAGGVAGGVSAQPTEADILRRVEEEQDAKQVTEARLSAVSAELSRCSDLQQGAERRAQLAEQQLVDLRARLQDAQTHLLAADGHRDALRHDMQHHEGFLKQLMETMKVDGVDLDLGLDMRLRLIQSRAEQLVKQEGTAVVENKTLAYGLQRKLKQQKERLESRELHADLLRKKVQELEEREQSGRSALVLERDGALAAVRRLHKKLERLQSELNAAKLAGGERLRAHEADGAQLKLTVLQQSDSLQQQSRTLQTLAEAKTRAEERLRVATSDLRGREQSLSGEVATLTHSLDQLSERERELVTFRMVICQMLGLDAASQATVANSQIIHSLDTLLHPPPPPPPPPHCLHHHHHHPPLAAFWPCPAHPEPHAGLREIQAQRDSTPAGPEGNSNNNSSNSHASSSSRASHYGP